MITFYAAMLCISILMLIIAIFSVLDLIPPKTWIVHTLQVLILFYMFCMFVTTVVSAIYVFQLLSN